MKAIFYCLILICASTAFAQDDVDANSQKALSQTKSLLKTPSERDQYIKGDAKAKDVDDKVTALTGSGKNKEEVYGIAADLMDKLTAESKGDPQKMQELLKDAQSDPQKFYEQYFNDSQKAKVRGLANDIDKDKPAVAPH